MRTIPGHLFPTTAVLLFAAACAEGPTAPRADDFPDEPAPEPRPEVVAFVDVRVVPMDADRVLTGQTVIVRGERIEVVGPMSSVTIPAGAFRIEGRGRYLMPGLADMHIHTPAQTFTNLRNDHMLFLANGVTTVRVMWGSTGLIAERERIASGDILGPSLLVASPGLDGPGGPWAESTPPVASAAEGRQRVIDHVLAGYDFIKVYNLLDLTTYDAIIDQAAALGVPVVGHVPSRVGIQRAQDAGQLTLEHFIGFKQATADNFNGGVLDMNGVRALAVRSADRGVWHTPTITVDALSRDRVQQIRAGQELQYVSPGMFRFFEDGFHNGLPSDVAQRENANHRAMIAAVAEAGAGLLIGTDAGFGWIIPGFSIHDELRSFRRAGLSPFVTLAAATSAAATAIGQVGEFGRVAAGLRADLILLADNPLRDLNALQELSGVMVRGRWLSRGVLAAMLDEIQATYEPR